MLSTRHGRSRWTVSLVAAPRSGLPEPCCVLGYVFPMRLSGRDGIGRAIYLTAVGRRVVIVLAFVKKTQQTPPAVLALAERRAKEVGL